MKNWTKIIIIVVLVLAVGGIYYGKNLSTKKDSGQVDLTNRLNEIIAVEKGEVKKPVIMQLSTTTCPACQEMYSVMERIDMQYRNSVVAGVVYLDDSSIREKAMEYAQQYSIRVVPTMIFLDKNGKLFLRQEGYMSEDEVAKVLRAMGVE